VNIVWALFMLVVFSAGLFAVALYLLRKGTGLRQ
jgi:ABC-type phosphate/phosphonate transport system permease subunit